ncbi:MAG: autotransporter-associated beta strand repeat-containing protein [Thermoguttaceae bacterium]
MRSLFRLALLLLLGLASATPLFADQNWLGGTSTDWNNPLNWSSAVPGPGDTVWVNTELGGLLDPSMNTTDTVLSLSVGGGTNSGAPTQGAGTMTIGATGNLTVTNEVWVGVYADTVNPASVSILNLAGTLNFMPTSGNNFHVGWNGGNAQFLMTGNSVLNQGNEATSQAGDTMYVGSGGLGATGLVSMSGSSTANLYCDMRFGYTDGVSGVCSGSLTMSGNSTINRYGGAYVIFGELPGGTGVLSMSGNAKFIGVDPTKQFITSIGHDGGMGTMTLTDNAQYVGAEMMIGQNTGVGTLNVSGSAHITAATESVNSWWYGWEGSFEVGRWGGTGTASFSGNSTLTVVGRTNIGNNSNGGLGSSISNGALTLSGYASMNTYAGPMRNYGWTWMDGGDMYVGCNEWDNGDNATDNAYMGGVGSLTVTDHATLTLNDGTFQIGIHGGTGTGIFSGTSTTWSAGGFNVGIGTSGTQTGSMKAYGNVTVSDNATITCQSLAVGDSGGIGVLTMSGNATINATNPGGYIDVAGCDSGYGTITMSGNSKINLGATGYWGEIIGGTQWWSNVNMGATLNLSGNAQITSPNEWLAGHIWDWDVPGAADDYTNNSTAYCHITTTDNAVLTVGYMSLGNGGGASATLVAGSNSVLNFSGGIDVGMSGGTATLTLNDNARMNINTGGFCTIGVGGNNAPPVGTGQGTVTLNGNAVIYAPYCQAILGRYGGYGEWDQNGGTTTVAMMWMGETNWTWTFGTDSGANTSTSNMNLYGGRFAAQYIQASYQTPAFNVATIHLSGVTMQALTDTATYFSAVGDPNFHVYVDSAGMTFDTGPYAVGLAQPLEQGTGSGAVTKIGTGDLTLGNSNTYTGDTNVLAGRLFLQAGTPYAGAGCGGCALMPGTPFVGAGPNNINVAANAELGATIVGASFTVSAPNTNVTFANNGGIAPSTDGAGGVTNTVVNNLNAAGQIVVDLVGSRDFPAVPVAVTSVPVFSAASVTTDPTNVIPRFANLGMYDVSVAYAAGTITLSTVYGGNRGFLGAESTLWSYSSNPSDTNWGDVSLGYALPPNGPNDRAWFNETALGATGNTCTLDISPQVNSMLFYAGNVFPGYYIQKTAPGATDVINLSAAGSTVASQTMIQVLGGANFIAPDIVMDSTPTVYISADSSLTVTGAMRQSVAGVGLNVIGGPLGTVQGTLVLSATSSALASNYTGPLSIDNAAVYTDYLTPGGITLRHSAALDYIGAAPVTMGSNSLDLADSGSIGSDGGVLTIPWDTANTGPASSAMTKIGAGQVVLTNGVSGAYVHLPSTLQAVAGTMTLQSSNGATFYLPGYFGQWGTASAPTVVQITGPLTLDTGSDIHIGDSCAGTLSVTNGATVNIGGWLWAGANNYGGVTGSAVVNVSNSTVNVGGVFELGSHSGSQGALNMTNGTITVGSDFHNSDYWTGDMPSTAPVGTTNMYGASRLTVNGTFFDGYWGSQGFLNIHTGSSFVSNGWATIGYNWGDAVSMSAMCYLTIDAGGTFTHNNVNTDGNPNDDSHFMICDVGGSGTVVNNGQFTDNRYVVLADSDTGSPDDGYAELDLNGGTFACPGFRVGWDSTRIDAGVSTAVIKFNGGILQMNGPCLNGWTAGTSGTAENDFFYNPYGGVLSLLVMTGGAKIDTNGYQMFIPENLVSGTAGDGGLTKLGAGTLTLGGANSYLGNTVISGGKLQVASSVAIPSGPGYGNVIDNAALDVFGHSITVNNLSGSGTVDDSTGSSVTFTVYSTATSMFSGTIADTGDGIQLIKTGPGTLILTGSNTYSAGTLISGGTLQIGNGGTSGSVAGNIVDNAALTFNRSDTVTYAGNLSGSGSLAQNGTGTLILTGTDTRTPGGAAVNAGTLQIGNGGTTGNVAGNVTLASSTVLAFDRSDSVTFANNVSGNGGVTKLAAGTVTMTGTNSYTGPTVVNGTGGQLVLSGPTAWGPALNNASGTNIEAGKLVFDYTASGTATDPVATVRSDLQSGLIHSTTAPAGCRIGYDDNNSTGNGVANGVVLEIALGGDATLDGTVNLADLSKVLTNWGKTNQTWAEGDFTYDGVVNLADLSIVLSNWGKTMPVGYDSLGGPAGAAGPCSAVPEPGTLALLAAGLMGLLAYAWRKRK